MSIRQEVATIFLCSVSQDESLRDELLAHLSSLKLQEKLEICCNQDIMPGSNIKQTIQEYFNNSKIILLFVSAHFLASFSLYEQGLAHILESDQTETRTVIPILVRPVRWQETIFGKLQVLPDDQRAVTEWENRDQAWLNVINGLRRAISNDMPEDLPVEDYNPLEDQQEAGEIMRTSNNFSQENNISNISGGSISIQQGKQIITNYHRTSSKRKRQS